MLFDRLILHTVIWKNYPKTLSYPLFKLVRSLAHPTIPTNPPDSIILYAKVVKNSVYLQMPWKLTSTWGITEDTNNPEITNLIGLGSGYAGNGETSHTTNSAENEDYFEAEETDTSSPGEESDTSGDSDEVSKSVVTKSCLPIFEYLPDVPRTQCTML